MIIFFKNDKINFKEIKEFIINLEKIPDPIKLSPEFHEYLIENKAKVGLGSRLTADIDDSLSPEIQSLRCVIKMTEYTPISGSNLSEFNKIPELFIKKTLIVLKNNDNKCFYIVILENF